MAKPVRRKNPLGAIGEMDITVPMINNAALKNHLRSGDIVEVYTQGRFGSGYAGFWTWDGKDLIKKIGDYDAVEGEKWTAYAKASLGKPRISRIVLNRATLTATGVKSNPRRRNPGVSDYLAAAKKAVVKHGSRIASEIAEETHAIATKAREEATKAEASKALTTPAAALELLAAKFGMKLVKANPKCRNPKKSRAKKSAIAKLRRRESKRLTSSLFRSGGTKSVSGLRAMKRNPGLPPITTWEVIRSPVPGSSDQYRVIVPDRDGKDILYWVGGLDGDHMWGAKRRDGERVYIKEVSVFRDRPILKTLQAAWKKANKHYTDRTT